MLLITLRESSLSQSITDLMKSLAFSEDLVLTLGTAVQLNPQKMDIVLQAWIIQKVTK